jgi:hypothetical protein
MQSSSEENPSSLVMKEILNDGRYLMEQDNGTNDVSKSHYPTPVKTHNHYRHMRRCIHLIHRRYHVHTYTYIAVMRCSPSTRGEETNKTKLKRNPNRKDKKVSHREWPDVRRLGV